MNDLKKATLLREALKPQDLGIKKGEDISIGFNGKFLTEVLDTFDGENIQGYFTKFSNAGVFESESAKGTQVLLMPVMLGANIK